MPGQKAKGIAYRLGKAQAREQFGPLVERLSTSGGMIEITDYGKTAAVILSYKDYLWLVAQSSTPYSPTRKLQGSAELTGNLDDANKLVTDSVRESISKTAREL